MQTPTSAPIQDFTEELSFTLGESDDSEPILRGENLERHLNCRIRGQADAIRPFARAVRRSERSHLNRPGRPKGSFLFLGPTGVGKTDTVKLTATAVYGEDADFHLRRLDMAEYQSPSSLEVLFGSGRDRQGLLGEHIDELNSRGGGFLLFDEIEKAHPAFRTAFLGATDDARLTMATGETKDLSWVYIIMTSNLGSAETIRMENVPYATVKRVMLSAASQHFRPEVLARFSDVIVFNRLTQPILLQICEDMIGRELQHIERTLTNHAGGMPVSVMPADREVLRYLVKRGYSRMLGARPMRQTIERELGDATTHWLDGTHQAALDLAQSRRALRFFVQGEDLVAEAVSTTPLN